MASPDTHRIQTALISVSDKTGIVEFAQALNDRGIRILSTGGTAKAIADAGIEVTVVSDVTGFPEVMDGRVKTLHPKIHGGLLADMGIPAHVQQMEEHGITSIDMAIVNLYPFEQTLATGAPHAEMVEKIDIGGPAMVRASAKNYKWTVVVVNPQRYDAVVKKLDDLDGCVDEETRLFLSAEAFRHTARYDSIIQAYMTQQTASDEFPEEISLGFKRTQELRYGENPHQSAALYGNFDGVFTQLHGKALSYNNIVDIDAASRLSLEFDEPAICIIKHTNPCGAATGGTLSEAWDKAFASDTKSPFGGIIACSTELDLAAAEKIDAIFTEVVIAPSFSEEALALLQKKKNRRLLTINRQALQQSLNVEVRSVAGGLLIQSSDTELVQPEGVSVVTKRTPSDSETKAMEFAWKVAKHVKSNAVIYCAADRVLAVGAGQMSRVDSAMIAAKKAEDAGLDLRGSAVASDAFFPFADGLLACVKAGASAVIQPGGSIRDEEVIAAADASEITMCFTGRRHFKH